MTKPTLSVAAIDVTTTDGGFIGVDAPGELTTEQELRLLRRLAAATEQMVYPDSPESCLEGRDKALALLQLLGLEPPNDGML